MEYVRTVAYRLNRWRVVGTYSGAIEFFLRMVLRSVAAVILSTTLYGEGIHFS